MDPARVIAVALVAGLALWGLAVLAGWVDVWWRARQQDRAMRRVSARLRCSAACRGGHTWSWPCERSLMADRHLRPLRDQVRGEPACLTVAEFTRPHGKAKYPRLVWSPYHALWVTRLDDRDHDRKDA